MKMLARRTLDMVAGRDQGMFDVVVAAYTQGVLPFAMLGLQCVGYKAGFDAPLRAWAAQNARPLSAGESSAVAPPKVARVEAGCEVTEPAKPRLGVNGGNTGLKNVVKAAGRSEGATPAKPKKRKSAGSSAADPRKKLRWAMELIVEPAPPERTNAGAGVKRESEDNVEAVSVKSESA